MSESFIRQSPLAPLGLAARARTAARAGVVLAEIPRRGQIVLRGDASKKAFRDAVARAIGIAPPERPNLVAGPADLALGPRALWLGPEEWLVATAPDATAVCATARSRRRCCRWSSATACRISPIRLQRTCGLICG